ncbi:MAG: hypothetical protein BWY46_01261 [Firmicutes bacterium ADurb.Bin300]|nr:MAG: hypothetical protein BWY46_01261 [Firmicutes bacterium ADurb.Bin300]
MKYAFVLGAGASASCGAPLQGALFKEYFKIRQPGHLPYERKLERELATFFNEFFRIDVNHGDLNSALFPTFEEVLGVLDLAILRNEALPNFGRENATFNSENRIRKCREYVVSLMASILYDKLNTVANNHKRLIYKLKRLNILDRTIFISLNYDLLIDNALSKELNQECILPDYGFDYVSDIKCVSKINPLYKIHGSLNWLYCSTCNEIKLTPFEKGVIELIRPEIFYEPNNIICARCHNLREQIIVPPTYYKDFSNYYLNQVWFKAERDLKEVDTIFFCGYSFPDADIHIKYLMKRIQTIRNRSLKIIVANNHDGKKDAERTEELIRYKRFLVNVNYTDESFDSLINNIGNYI